MWEGRGETNPAGNSTESVGKNSQSHLNLTLNI